MKLIQIPELDIESRIKEEIEINPALEINDASESDSKADEYNEANEESLTTDDSSEREAYEDDNPFDYYYKNNADDEEEDMSAPIRAEESFHDYLKAQYEMLNLDEIESKVALHIIGSIDDDGYLRRSAAEISDDLAFKDNLNVEESFVKQIITQIQTFEPAGVAAHDLQECLILQLERFPERSFVIDKSIEVLKKSFSEFSKKHYARIIEKHKIDEDILKEIIDTILRLSPKPGISFQSSAAQDTPQYIIPDFFVMVENDKIHIALNDGNTPELKISTDFNLLLDNYKSQTSKTNAEKEAEQFVRQRIDAAKWFIDALKQRKETLLLTMKAITEMQREYFITGDPITLKPMILKDVADKIHMDISTVSRVSRSKYVQTPFGIFPLKHFFTDSYTNDEGEDISIINIKNLLEEIINNENKKKPYSDAKLTSIINEKGYNIARRTVAKYRDQLNIPVAQLRKQL